MSPRGRGRTGRGRCGVRSRTGVDGSGGIRNEAATTRREASPRHGSDAAGRSAWRWCQSRMSWARRMPNGPPMPASAPSQTRVCSSHSGVSKLRWISSRCMPTEFPAHSVTAESTRKATNPPQDGNQISAASPPMTCAISQSDLTGAQTTRPSVAEVSGVARTRLVSMRVMAGSPMGFRLCCWAAAPWPRGRNPQPRARKSARPGCRR